MAHTQHPSNGVILGWNVQGDLGPLSIYTSSRGKTVFYPRAPPLQGPSPTQEFMRELFRTAAAAWRCLTPYQRVDWLAVARTTGLGINGYCLWVWYYRARDRSRLATLEKQSGIQLAKPQ